MQYFGILETKYEEVFLTSSFLYFNNEDEKISVKELKQLIKTNKDRKKNIAGTIIMYNPVVTPEGYDSNKFLLDQEFDSFGEYIEIKQENYITTFKQGLQQNYKGKLVEIKNLFNLVESNIDVSSLLTKFNSDLEKYNSSQNTEFDRDIMYFDAQTYVPSGKFVFFAWGEKINAKEFVFINNYAQTIYQRTKEMGKKIAFAYKREKTQKWSEDFIQFASPIQKTTRYKNSVTKAIKQSFESIPPVPTAYE